MFYYASNDYFAFWFSGPAENSYAIGLENSRAGGGLYSGRDYVLNTWYHYLLTYENSTIKFYINGILSNTATRSWSVNNSRISIGSRSDGAYPWVGCLSSLRIYNRVLNQSEITALASEFAPTA